MIQFIVGSVVAAVCLWIGYSMGKNSSVIPEETQRQVKNLIRALPIKRDIGAVPRPTAADIKRFENPVLKAEEEEMSNTFKEIIK